MTFQVIANGGFFTNITVSAIAPTATGVYRNLSTVSNTGDTNASNNSDPANIQIGNIPPFSNIPICNALS
jgi:hypothetical protein